MDSVRRVVGAMTGTSLDGIDVALVDVGGRGLDMTAKLRRHVARPLGVLGDRLRAAAEQTAMSAGAFTALGRELADIHADAIGALRPADESPFDLVAVHGQTVYHAPPLSWQLLNPAPLAAALRCPVVCDLRQADLAAGGQGAPITPLADWILFRPDAGRRAVVNLGGYCNLTILAGDGGPDAVEGRDVCACNHVLDAVARAALGRPFDEGGHAALAGRAAPERVAALAAALERQRADDRSLGTGDELGDGVARDLAPSDAAATAVAAVAQCIGAVLNAADVRDVVVAGGGARNEALVAALAEESARSIMPSDDLGVPVEAREATAIAVLGALCADGVPITLPQVTGCARPAPVAGVWTYGGTG